MKRFICLGVAFAIFAPAAIGQAEAATKKKQKKNPQVAGFVQTAGLSGSLRNTDRFGERNYNRDNTHQFFDRTTLRFN
jgi:hypothetical protein